MGLTRPRAYQIFDIDYKQAVRVITLTNITLSGGSPSQVDGVSLSLNDRVLVAGQSIGSQNGLYYVTTVGTGSNGTWSRSVDGNETGEIQAGMIVMVTEGTIYHDSQWKLTTNDPIVIGSSDLVFEQSSAYSFGTISVSGQANVVADTVGDVLTFAAGNNISLTTDAGSDTVTIAVTGISLNSISNGSSNVNVVSSGGNVTVGVGGTGNVAVFSSSGSNITGTLGVSSNVSGGNLTTDGQITATGNITGGNILTGGNIVDTVGALSIVSTASGNINLAPNGTNVIIATTTGANITGTLGVTGNITGDNIFGNGSGLTGIDTFKTVAITGGNTIVADSIADTLTLSAGSGIVIIADASTDTITISAGGTGVSIFSTGGDMELVTDLVTDSLDLGLVTEAVTENNDLGELVTSGIIYPNMLVIPTYTVSTLPSASPAAQMIYVSNEVGGAVPAFSDGTNWRRVTDRAIVS